MHVRRQRRAAVRRRAHLIAFIFCGEIAERVVLASVAMRLKAYDQISKETALEALRDALRSYDSKYRPRKGGPGYGAVVAALSYWRGVDFSTLPEKERYAILITVTDWWKQRQGKPGPHARVDREAHGRLCGVLRAVLAEELGPLPGTRVAVLWNDDGVYEGVVDERLGRARARSL